MRHLKPPRLRRPFLALVLLFLTSCGAPAPASPARAASPPPRLVSFIGDSLTVGLFATSVDRSYANLLTTSWSATMIDRVGVGSVHASYMLSSIDSMQGGASDVVVELGTNDFGVTLVGDFEQTYRAVIAALRRHEPAARLTCLGLWRGTTDRTPWGQGPDAYDEVIKAACPGPFVSLADAYMDQQNHGPAKRTTFWGPADSFHPNDLGHATIATLIADQSHRQG